MTGLGCQAAVLNVPDWRYDDDERDHSLFGLLLFMSFIGWLSNREIGRSLAQGERL